MVEAMERVRFMRLCAFPGQPLDSLDSDEEDDVLEEIARRVGEEEKKVAAVKGGPEGREASGNPLAAQLRQALIEEFGKTSLSGEYLPNPPVRGPDGEAQIWLKPGATPVSMPPYQLTRERRNALTELVDGARASGKLEDGRGPWNTPAFPVPKKRRLDYTGWSKTFGRKMRPH